MASLWGRTFHQNSIKFPYLNPNGEIKKHNRELRKRQIHQQNWHFKPCYNGELFNK